MPQNCAMVVESASSDGSPIPWGNPNFEKSHAPCAVSGANPYTLAASRRYRSASDRSLSEPRVDAAP